MGYTYQTVFPCVILEAMHALDKRSGNETMTTLTMRKVNPTPVSKDVRKVVTKKTTSILER